MSCLALPRVVLAFTLVVLLTGAACSAIPSPQAQGAEGRSLSRDDWIAHLPPVCLMTPAVIVVDAAFIVRIYFDRGRIQRGRAVRIRGPLP